MSQCVFFWGYSFVNAPRLCERALFSSIVNTFQSKRRPYDSINSFEVDVAKIGDIGWPDRGAKETASHIRGASPFTLLYNLRRCRSPFLLFQPIGHVLVIEPSSYPILFKNGPT